MPAERLSTKLRRLRLSAGLTQHETARRAGISVGMLRDLEQGRTTTPRKASLAALATTLGVDPAELAGERTPAIRVNILGPFELLVDGAPTPVGGHKQALILGMLALAVDAGILTALIGSINLGLFGFTESLDAPFVVESIVIETLTALALALWVTVDRMAQHQHRPIKLPTAAEPVHRLSLIHI